MFAKRIFVFGKAIRGDAWCPTPLFNHELCHIYADLHTVPCLGAAMYNAYHGFCHNIDDVTPLQAFTPYPVSVQQDLRRAYYARCPRLNRMLHNGGDRQPLRDVIKTAPPTILLVSFNNKCNQSSNAVLMDLTPAGLKLLHACDLMPPPDLVRRVSTLLLLTRCQGVVGWVCAGNGDGALSYH